MRGRTGRYWHDRRKPNEQLRSQKRWRTDRERNRNCAPNYAAPYQQVLDPSVSFLFLLVQKNARVLLSVQAKGDISRIISHVSHTHFPVLLDFLLRVCLFLHSVMLYDADTFLWTAIGLIKKRVDPKPERILHMWQLMGAFVFCECFPCTGLNIWTPSGFVVFFFLFLTTRLFVPLPLSVVHAAELASDDALTHLPQNSEVTFSSPAESLVSRGVSPPSVMILQKITFFWVGINPQTHCWIPSAALVFFFFGVRANSLTNPYACEKTV